MRTFFTFVSLALALVGCLDRELVPLDASADVTATDAHAEGGSACADCDAAHCVDGECVECTAATEAADCTEPERPTCVANVCGACTDADDCGRFPGLPACATAGPLLGQCVACDAATDCLDPAAARCDVTTRACVPCEANPDCARFPDTPVCAADGERVGECVTCAADTDCTDPTASRCDLTTNTCVPCDDDDQCTGPNENVCDAGTCVQCTEDTAATHCGANSCDPVARACTTTARDSLASCQPCLSDTECDGEAACVPLRFAGADRGHYCLAVRPEAGCLTNDPPYRVGLPDRRSRSGAEPSTYCGINEDLTTCEAVLVAMESTACDSADPDACPEGGLCARVSSGDLQCTYACSQGSECPLTGTLSLCTNLAGDDYCGRR